MAITADRPVSDTVTDPSVELPVRAAELLDLVRSNAASTEGDRRVAQENIDALAAAGLFKISVPKRLGVLGPTSERKLRASSIVSATFTSSSTHRSLA